MSYNGWSNYETWLVNLHFGDALLSDAEHLESFPRNDSDVKQAVEEYIDADYRELNSPFFRDAINSFLADCDWQEIYENLLRDSTPWALKQ